jgi:hypothetical protein
MNVFRVKRFISWDERDELVLETSQIAAELMDLVLALSLGNISKLSERLPRELAGKTASWRLYLKLIRCPRRFLFSPVFFFYYSKLFIY